MAVVNIQVARLDRLASRVNRAHAKAEAASRDVVECALEAGRALIEAKATLPHGRWYPWLEANVSVGVRMCQQYMRLAKNLASMPPQKAKCISHLPLNEALKAIVGVGKPELHTTGDEHWFTPADLIRRARSVMGQIDLDPASCSLAQRTVRAKRYYSIEQDGLAQDWRGRIFMNPPFSRQKVGQFVEKLCEHFEDGAVTEALTLANNATDTDWFARAADHASAICFPRSRVRFVSPTGKKPNSPFGQVIIYFGPNVTRFKRHFSEVGTILIPANKEA